MAAMRSAGGAGRGAYYPPFLLPLAIILTRAIKKSPWSIASEVLVLAPYPFPLFSRSMLHTKCPKCSHFILIPLSNYYLE